MNEEACHLKVIDGEVALRVIGRFKSVADVLRPLDSPNNWVKVIFSTEPDATSSPLAGITEANKMRPPRDKLGAFGGSIGHQLHDG